MTEYRIVSHEFYSILEAQVMELMRDGWRPSGGIAVAMAVSDPVADTHIYLYAQAMVRKS